MRLPPTLRRAALVILVPLFALILYIPIQQRILRIRAERLHAEILALQLHPGTFADIQRMQKEWGAHGYSRGPCTPEHCAYNIHFIDLFEWLSDKYQDGEGNHRAFWNHAFQLYALFGGHPTGVFGNLLVRGNRMWGANFSIGIEAYPGTGRSEGDVYEVIAVINSGTRLSSRNFPISAIFLRQGFRTLKFMNCANCEEVDVDLTHQTDPADIERFNHLNLNCITRWHLCRHPDELAPEIWKQASLDPDSERLPDDDPEVCAISPTILSREANDIALVKVLSVKTLPEPIVEAEIRQVAVVRVLQPLKHGRLYRAIDTVEFPYRPDSMWPRNSFGSHLAVGQQYLFLYRQPQFADNPTPLYLEPCHALLATPENTALIRQGIALDNSGGEFYDYLGEP
jgi:hypothetical protein